MTPIDADDVPRHAPEVVRRKVQAGEALLVCAYDNEEVCRLSYLEGSISLAELRRRLPGLARDQELIFYCA